MDLPVGREGGHDLRDAVGHGQTAHIGQHHTHGSQDRDLVGVAGQRGIQCAVWHIDERIEHRQTDVGSVGIEQRRCKAVPEAKDGKARQWHARQHQVTAILAQPGIMLVDIGSYQRVPQHVDHTDDEKHKGCLCRFESIHIGIEYQQIHAYRLIDEVLCKVA